MTTFIFRFGNNGNGVKDLNGKKDYLYVQYEVHVLKKCRKSPVYTLQLSQKSDFQPSTTKPDNRDHPTHYGTQVICRVPKLHGKRRFTHGKVAKYLPCVTHGKPRTAYNGRQRATLPWAKSQAHGNLFCRVQYSTHGKIKLVNGERRGRPLCRVP